MTDSYNDEMFDTLRDNEGDGECCKTCDNTVIDQDGEITTCECTDEKCKCHIVLTDRQKAEKDLFEMVYNWGRAGIVTDYECNAFQKRLQEVRNG